MKRIIHPAGTRGHTLTTWLHSYHTFSFGEYFDPQRKEFGMLRVLNDDVVQSGKGFDLHPHKDMEILSILLQGKLKHVDNQGNEEVMEEGMVQAMTAGKGLYRGEFNASDTDEVHFLHVWIYPERNGLDPSNRIMKYLVGKVRNGYLNIVVPVNREKILSIHRNASVTYGDFARNESTVYTIKEGFNDSKVVSKTEPFGPEGAYNSFNYNEIPTRRIDYIFVENAKVLKYRSIEQSGKFTLFLRSFSCLFGNQVLS